MCSSVRNAARISKAHPAHLVAGVRLVLPPVCGGGGEGPLVERVVNEDLPQDMQGWLVGTRKYCAHACACFWSGVGWCGPVPARLLLLTLAAQLPTRCDAAAACLAGYMVCACGCPSASLCSTAPSVCACLCTALAPPPRPSACRPLRLPSRFCCLQQTGVQVHLQRAPPLTTCICDWACLLCSLAGVHVVEESAEKYRHAAQLC